MAARRSLSSPVRQIEEGENQESAVFLSVSAFPCHVWHTDRKVDCRVVDSERKRSDLPTSLSNAISYDKSTLIHRYVLLHNSRDCLMRSFNIKTSTSLHILPLSGSDHDDPELQKLEDIIEYSARLLPAEGPLSGFVFLNPLHAFEGLPFDDAVRKASRLFGCQPYLPEQRYREELNRKRIEVFDLRSALETDVKSCPWDVIGGLVSRLDLRLHMLLNPVVIGSDTTIDWLMAEQSVLRQFQRVASLDSRKRILADSKRWAVRDLISHESATGGKGETIQHVLHPVLPILAPLMSDSEQKPSDQQVDTIWEEFALRALWAVCCEGVRKLASSKLAVRPSAPRPRDAVLQATVVDPDTLVDSVLIRFCAAFCDQGQAHSQLPHRDKGFLQSFCELYRSASPRTLGRWLRKLPAELSQLETGEFGVMASIRASLEDLGIAEDEWETFLPATLVALRGWGSMIRQMEVRADRFPHPAPRGTLLEFVAVRLILDRLALGFVAREELGYTGPLRAVRVVAMKQAGHEDGPTMHQQAFVMFQLAQSFGWQPSFLHHMSQDEWAAVLDEVRAFDTMERQRVFHQAYERRYTIQALDAIAARASQPHRRPTTPRFQAVFCIDTREESFSRHLEEAAPDVETFGLPGFFCVPMYYRGATDAHPVASCPIIVRPQHWVNEEVPYSEIDSHRRRARHRRILGMASHGFANGSRGLALGALYTASVGVLASAPLLARVLFPRWASRVVRAASSVMAPPTCTRLTVDRIAPTPGPTEDGLGFNVEERTNIAERVLRFIGLTTQFSRLVLLIGHGARGLNNPHLSAYNCGACSGNASGPNARALAAFLNDPEVREQLAARNLPIPFETVFLAGLHNTSADTVEFYDLDLLPRTHRADYEAARSSLNSACGKNARERCRRFESAPLGISEQAALLHVASRVEDLAQTRTEFGNASNAMCFIGRRSRIRGLFFDRRSFFHSYDPTQDDEHGSILAKILAPTVPVCQGINLEYFFSAADPSGWGAGTKLPHNITSLLGVMNGAESDLRQGLPWQGTEIHEPVRLLFVIESTPSTMLRIMEQDPWVGRILKNGWSHLAILDPHTAELRMFQNGEFHLHHTSVRTLPRVRSSAEWYVGRRDALGFADVERATGSPFENSQSPH